MSTPDSRPDPDPAAGLAFKSRGGWRRVVNATRYTLAGLRAAFRHEAAFRQELALGLPLIGLAPWLAPGRWQLLAMVCSVLLVWVVELLNSSVEALADAVSVERHPLLGRAKDLGSAAVGICLLQVVLVWAVVLWP